MRSFAAFLTEIVDRADAFAVFLPRSQRFCYIPASGGVSTTPNLAKAKLYLNRAQAERISANSELGVSAGAVILPVTIEVCQQAPTAKKPFVAIGYVAQVRDNYVKQSGGYNLTASLQQARVWAESKNAESFINNIKSTFSFHRSAQAYDPGPAEIKPVKIVATH